MRSRLLWRAITWRAASSLAFFAMAVVTVAAATIGPLYISSADQSAVQETLSKAPLTQSGVVLTSSASASGGTRTLVAQADGLVRRSRGVGVSFGRQIVTTDVPTEVLSPVAGRPDELDLVSRTGACATLQFVAGHCPTGPGQVAVSARSAVQLRARLGTSLSSSGRSSAGSSAQRPKATVVVTGIYRPGDPASPAWWGANFFAYGTKAVAGADEQLDAGFVTPAGAAQLARSFSSSSWVDLPLRTGGLAATSVPELLGTYSAWKSNADATGVVVVGSGLPTLLATAEADESVIRTIVAVVTLQLVVLSLLVLYFVARATSRLRESDVRVAELRGLPTRSILGLVLREEVVLLAAAVPAGVALGFAIVSVAASRIFHTPAPTLDSLVAGVAIAAFAAGVLAAALGSRQLYRPQLAGESQMAADRRRARNTAVVDALGLALAAAGTAEIVASSNRAGSSTDPLALAGPGLLALGLSLLASRLLPLLAIGISRLAQWSRRVALALASLSIRRRPGVSRNVVVPTIAAALLVFSVTGLELVHRNSATQTAFQVGAPVVLTAHVRPGVDFLAAVDHADPSGHEAMATAVVQTQYGRTIAVDTSRLAAVAAWPASGLGRRSLVSLARELHPPTPPAHLVPASARRLVVRADLQTALHPRPDLRLSLYDERQQYVGSVDFGALRAGVHDYTASTAGLCSSGCRLSAFGVYWSRGRHRDAAASNETLTLESLGAAGKHGASALPVSFTRPGAWTSSGAVTTDTSTSGLTLHLDLATLASPPAVNPAYVPARIPAVVTSEFVALNQDPATPRRFEAIGLDQSQLPVDEIASVPILPRLGRNGALIDLGLAELSQTSPTSGAEFQIWCHDPPSSALIARLAGQGVTVVRSDSASTALSHLLASGPSLGFDLFILAGVGAVLLALGSLVFAMTSSARERGIELTGLFAAGVPRRQLAWSVLLEAVMISLTAAVFGSLAGVLGAALSMPGLPELPAGYEGPPLDLATPWAAVGLAAAVVVAAFLVASVLATAIMVRQIRPDQLRVSA